MNQFVPQDKELFAIFSDAVKEGLELVKQIENQKKYFGTHFEFPFLDDSNGSIPSFSRRTFSEIKNFGDIFGTTDNSIINVYNHSKIAKFIDFAKNKEYFQKYVGADTLKEFSESKYSDTFINMVFSYVIDKYSHSYKNKQFNKKCFSLIYSPIEKGLFEKKLKLNIVVPILMLTFRSKIHRLDENLVVN